MTIAALVLTRVVAIARLAVAHAIVCACVFWRVLVALWAMGDRCAFLPERPYCGAVPKSALKVFLQGYWFKMARIDAATDPTQVVNLKASGNRTNEKFVGYPVGLRHALIGVPHNAVSADIEGPEPEPASGLRLWRNLVQEPVHHRGSTESILSHGDIVQRWNANRLGLSYQYEETGA